MAKTHELRADDTMRQIVETAVRIFRSQPDADEDEILKRMLHSDMDHRAAVQLVVLLPLAYGRVLLSASGVLLPDFYYHDCDGKPGKGRLSALPLWHAAMDCAKQDLEPAACIASRSPEVRAANAALLDGRKLESLVWGPPVFLWPIEPAPGLAGAVQTPGWWRQIWDGPAWHSVSPGELTTARMAMVVGILVALTAVGAVVYYTISLLLELR